MTISAPSDIEVQPAEAADLKYVDHLQRKNAEDLAFYPRITFEREINQQRILLARVNGEPAGYIYHGALRHQLKIHQACIEYDLRGQLYGAALIRHLRLLAEAGGVQEIVLRCGSDIEANGFWRAMGFHCIAIRKGGARRMRDINVWCERLAPGLWDIRNDAIEPSRREKDASKWAFARKQGKSSSRFLRGGNMEEYRREIEEMTDQSDD